MQFLIGLLINGLIIYAAAAIFSGIHVTGYAEAVITALVLAIVNGLIRPIITFFTLPITVLTLGLFLIIINGAMVLLADFLLDGFRVDGMFWAVILSFLLAIGNFFNGGTSVE